MAYYSYPTNFSNGTIANTVSKFFFSYPKEIVGDNYGAGILSIIFLLSLTLSMVSGIKKALLTSLFITSIFSVFLVRLNAVNIIVPVSLIVFTGGILILEIFSKDSGY